jgi:hypothetical protein
MEQAARRVIVEEARRVIVEQVPPLVKYIVKESAV